MDQLVTTFLISTLLCAGFLYALQRLLPGNFLAAGQSARSNHTTLARQIGGLALIPAIVITLWLFRASLDLNLPFLASLTAAMLLVWLVGGLDDRFELPESIRLISQFVAAATVCYGLGPSFRLLPDLLPLWLEATLIVIALVAAMNITNFMDGLDLMTAAGIGVPLIGAVALAGLNLSGSVSGGIAAAAAGGLFGFALFNRPPATIFLGDSGSLPLGLLTGTVLLILARETHIVIALILPLYYLLDSISTMALRLRDGENILKAHSKHAYQIAKRSGWSVLQVVTHVALLNLVLAACAIFILESNVRALHVILAGMALAATTWLLLKFRGKISK